MIRSTSSSETTALLLSGGLDSAILLAHLLDHNASVQPIYIASGCIWEEAEKNAIQQLIAALDDPAVQPIVELHMPIEDLYGNHWSTTSWKVPDSTTPDEAVHLVGRNPLLLVKAMLWCQMHSIHRLALATLASNPFADASPQFFEQFQQAIETATSKPIEILRPFAKFGKAEVLALGAQLPLHLTFSCLAPVNGLHCGQCNKCAERKMAVQSLPCGDPTVYANTAHSTDVAFPSA